MVKKTIVFTEKASSPSAGSPYSQANAVGNFVFVSGQMPIEPGASKIVDGGFEAQATRVFQNLKAVLEASGSDLDHVVKTTVFLSDISNFKSMNEVYKTFFTKDFPARSAVQVAALPLGAMIEVEAIAAKKK